MRIHVACGDYFGIGQEICNQLSRAIPKVTHSHVTWHGLAEQNSHVFIADGCLPAPTFENTGYAALQSATQSCLAEKNAALVTAPVSKERLNKIGFNFPGQTEYLASACNLEPDAVTMAMIGPRLRVFLTTTHLPLAKAISSITPRNLLRTIYHGFHVTSLILGASPRMAVAALNPHAGENGLFGREERDVLIPTTQQICQYLQIPELPVLPADTLFHRAVNFEHFDAVVCLYHDQGLIPFKLLHFYDGVNLTIGLPFVRTSPDHGTAYDIAGRGLADPSSTIAAIRLAEQLAPLWHKIPPVPSHAALLDQAKTD